MVKCVLMRSVLSLVMRFEVVSHVLLMATKRAEMATKMVQISKHAVQITKRVVIKQILKIKSKMPATTATRMSLELSEMIKFSEEFVIVEVCILLEVG